MKNMEEKSVPKDRCIICGRRFGEPREKPLCNWCGTSKFYEVLSSVVDVLDSQLAESERIDVDDNPLFSLVADLGMLGSKHPLMAMPWKVISSIITELAGRASSEVDINKLWNAAGLRNIHDFLELLLEQNLITLDEHRETVKTSMNSIFHKAYADLEIKPRFNRSTAFILGYITLKSMKETLEKINSNGTLLCGEGITKLYSISIDENDKVRIRMPKSYLATISFVFGSWAKGWDEFSELELHKFLASCGITGREYRYVVGMLTGASSAVHGLYKEFKPEVLGRKPIYRFKLSDEYVRVRERIYERMRERE